MKKTAFIMGMPVAVDIVDESAQEKDIKDLFSYFWEIDKQFSTYKRDSEIEKINRGEIKKEDCSPLMKKILVLCEKTKKETDGYFDIEKNGKLDPSGIVKGYAIFEGAKKLRKKGYRNFYVEIAGDIQVYGVNKNGGKWKVGIENPFNRREIIKVLNLTDKGVATSGTYIRGSHIYDPVAKKKANEIAGITVIGPNIFEADRFATAAFAMGKKGLNFIEKLTGFDAYMVTKDKRGHFTSGFEKFVIS